MKIKVGCCGFSTSQKNYFKKFEVIEIQKTFYQIPQSKTLQRWREDAPQDFEFSLKAWQLITHPPTSPTYRRLKIKIPKTKFKNYGFFKPTEEVFWAWKKTEEAASLLKTKIIVFQSPASFTPTSSHKLSLKSFFKKIKRKDYTLVWEPRGEWQEDEVLFLCKDLDLVYCKDPFKGLSSNRGIGYFRLHGKDTYNYRYTEKDLLLLKNILLNLKITKIYVMFNNVWMLEDAIRFKRLLDRS